MSTYRMIAIDLDGTLLSPAGTVTDRCREAIHQVLSAGMLVCFATGRNWTESRLVLDAVQHYATAVFVGGAMVVDTSKQVTLHRTLMQPELAAEVCAFFEASGHAALALQDTGDAGVDYLVSGNVALNEPTARWMQVTSATVHPIEKLGRHEHPHTIRVGIVAEAAEIGRLRVEVDEKFGSRVMCQNLQVPASGLEVMEVFDPAVNKWEGILHVARRHDISPADIVAIGDDSNDIPMIRSAGLGVAMGNARPAVQAVAKRVIGTNAEDGLARFLEELVETHTVVPVLSPDEN